MEAADAFYKVMNSDYGYVSHSFNQFLIVDENGRIVTLDHGDAYPRSVVFMRYYADAGTGKFTSSSYNGKLCSVGDMLTFAGSIGDNQTGGSVGGLAETRGSYIMAYSYDGVGGDGDRYPYYHWMDIATGKSWSAKVSNTPGCTTPMLASTGLDGGYMLWNEKTDYTKSDTLHYLKYSADGKPGEVKSAQKAPLSDCNPIAYKNGVVWYVTDQSAPTFYTLDDTGVKAYPAKASGTVKPEKPTEPEKPIEPENPNQSNALYDPRKAPSLLDAVRMSNRLQSRIGYFYDSVIDADGNLWDLHGEYVENRNTDFSARKPEIMMKNMKQVADTWIGGDTILALTNDGSLWAWGEVGTLGLIDDFDGHSYRPMKVMDGVKSISAYTSGVMVLKDDHSLWYWGSPLFGEDGSGKYYESNMPCRAYPVMNDVEMVASGNARYAALKTDGSVWVWGADGYSGADKMISCIGEKPQKPTKILDNMISVGMRGENGWAIDRNGGLWCWGNNTYGHVGNGGKYNYTDEFSDVHAQLDPVKVIEKDVISAWLGMAVMKDGTYYRWGIADWVQPNVNSTVPVKTNERPILAGKAQIQNDGAILVPTYEETFRIENFLPMDASQPDPKPDSRPNICDQFIDIPENAWYTKGVEYVYEKGLMSGTGKGMFSPNGQTSRGMIVTILWRLAGSPEAGGEAAFQDVKPSDYYSEAAQWAAEQGIVGGYGDGRFGPNNHITREQLAVMLYGYADKQGYDVSKRADLSGFSDISKMSDYAADAMCWANANGLISGVSANTLAPDGQATRAQVATVIMALDKLNA